MLTSRQHHRSVGVARLVWPAVAHTGLLQRINPECFPDRSVAGPSLARPWVLEDFLVGQVGECLLRFQGFQRRAEQLDAAQGINIGPSCSVPTFTENPANCQYNSVYVQCRTYTPTWTQTSATPSVGNGTLTGNYIRHGYQCMVEIELIAESTTVFGDGTTAYRFSLPFPGHLSFNQRGFPVRIFDTSAGADFTGWASIGAGQDYITISVGPQKARATSPMTWASSDMLQCSFLYMVR